MNRYHSDIIDHFGNPLREINTPKGIEMNYNCPFCIENRGDPDTKGHLFVNDRFGVYHCYRCGASGVVKSSDNKGYSNYELEDNERLLESLNRIVNSDDNDPIDMVIPRKKAYEDTYARAYMNSRGFTDEMMDKYDMRVGNVFSNLLGYVIIPNIVKEVVMTDMYCARSFTGSSRKYMNPPSSQSGKSVYNLHRIKPECDRLIVCEGALNAIAAGDNAVALYGKECSEVKLTKIIKLRPKEIVVNLDLDAKNKAYDLAKRIHKRDPSILIKILLIDKEGYKDAADFLSKGEIDEYHNLVETTKYYDPLIDSINDILGGN